MNFWKTHQLLIGTVIIVYACAFFYISVFDTSIFSAYGYPVHNGGDSSEYALLTQNLVEHGEFTLDSAHFIPEMFRSPGYSFFLAPLYFIDHSFYLAIAVQIALVVGSALLIFAIGRKMLPSPWPTIVALAFALDPTTIFYSLSIWSDTLFIFLLLSVFYLLFILEPRIKVHVFLAGILLGFATLVRSGGEYLILVLAFFMCIDGVGRIGYTKTAASLGILLVAYSAILTPWYIRNYHYSGALGISSTGPNAILLYDVHDFLVRKTGKSNEAITAEILKALPTHDIQTLRSIKYSAPMMTLAEKYIKQYPIQYGLFHLSGSANLLLASSIRDIANNLPRLHAGLETLYLVGGNEINIKSLIVRNPLKALLYSIKGEPLLSLERVVRFLSIILAVFAIFLTFRSGGNRLLISLSAIIVLYIALTVGPISYPRYRISAEPFLFLVTSAGIVELLRFKQKILRSKF